MALRASLGAGKWRLARQFLTENLLLSLVGGVLGVGIGYATIRAISATIPPGMLPPEIDVSMDVDVLLFALAVTVLTGILFGLAPAIQATRSNLTEPMKEGGQGTTPSGGAPACAARSSWPRSRSRSCCSSARGCCCGVCSACSPSIQGSMRPT